MYIAPNTTFYLLGDIPLNPDYTETLWFASLADQLAYFTNNQARTIYQTFTQNSYQREGRNYCRVEAKYGDIYKSNYMMFKNISHENKWFFAFVTSVEYINENVCEIEYVVDVIQTWLFELQLKPCFIERQHTTTDAVGDNLVPESLDLGDYVCDEPERSGHMNTYAFVAVATVDSEKADASGYEYGGIYSGLAQTAWDETEMRAGTISTWIQDVTGTKGADFMVALYAMPYDFVPPSVFDPDEPDGNTSPVTINKQISKYNSGAWVTGGSFTPKNNKLYTYPYNFLYVANTDGNNATFPYEYFSTAACNFSMVGTYAPDCEIVVYPHYYKGVTDNVDEMLTMRASVQCPWACNSFEAWLAYAAVDFGTAIMPSFSQISTERYLGAGQTGMGVNMGKWATNIGNVTNVVASGIKSAIAPPQSGGNVQGDALMSNRKKDFYFYRKHIREEFAQIIDSYFNMFGYAIKKVQMPNIHARQGWTYIKTINADFGGTIPSGHMLKIREIFNNGVAFWADTAHVGDYTRTNAVLP